MLSIPDRKKMDNSSVAVAGSGQHDSGPTHETGKQASNLYSAVFEETGRSLLQTQVKIKMLNSSDRFTDILLL